MRQTSVVCMLSYGTETFRFFYTFIMKLLNVKSSWITYLVYQTLRLNYIYPFVSSHTEVDNPEVSYGQLDINESSEN